MKACLFWFACLVLLGFVSPNQEAHHNSTAHRRKPVKHQSTPHKNHHSDPKASLGKPGALKNIILHQALPQQMTPENPQVKSSLVSTLVNKAANQGGLGTVHSEKEKGAVQGTGRAILVHNGNSGVEHVLQDSANGKAPVIVINSDAAGDNGAPLDPFSQDCLDAHNNYRAKHGVPPLMWSRELAEGAQSWADQLASTDSLQHDEVAIQNRKMGENLAYFQPAVPKCQGAMVDNCVNCREMVQRWYDEVKNYDFDKGGPKTATAPYKHFSQLIWANTAEVGVGTAVSKRYGFITVARYRPTGNEGVFEDFIRNVPPEGGPLPTVLPSLEDNLKPISDVKTSSSTVETPAASPATVESTASQTANTKQATSSDVTVLPQTQKSSATSGTVIPAKAAATVPDSTAQKSTKLQSQTTPIQPDGKEQHRKGGFVHTLTANDGTKAQVYLSKNGAHAGIVFRNEISRVNQDQDSTGVKRTINVL